MKDRMGTSTPGDRAGADEPTLRQWQTMDTAPKKGERFLAWFPYAKNSSVVAWQENVYDKGKNWTLDGGESATQTFDPPTHWMPLPAPPRPEGA